jgi:hypothetical protein
VLSTPTRLLEILPLLIQEADPLSQTWTSSDPRTDRAQSLYSVDYLALRLRYRAFLLLHPVWYAM